MKYAIIEDEQIAMQNLDQMIRQLRPHYQKIFQTDTAENHQVSNVRFETRSPIYGY